MPLAQTQDLANLPINDWPPAAAGSPISEYAGEICVVGSTMAIRGMCARKYGRSKLQLNTVVFGPARRAADMSATSLCSSTHGQVITYHRAPAPNALRLAALSRVYG